MDKTCGNCNFRRKIYKPNKRYTEPEGCDNRNSPWRDHEVPTYSSACSHWELKEDLIGG